MSDEMTRAQSDAFGDAVQRVEFDSPFRITDAYDVERAEDVAYTPTVEHDDEDDILIDGVPASDSEWWAISGMTGQYGYNGAVMHSSEYISGGMAEALYRLRDGDSRMVFVVTTVETDDPERPAGWTVLYRDGALSG